MSPAGAKPGDLYFDFDLDFDLQER